MTDHSSLPYNINKDLLQELRDMFQGSAAKKPLMLSNYGKAEEIRLDDFTLAGDEIVSGHYIGQFIAKSGKPVSIWPKWGRAALPWLLARAANVYLPLAEATLIGEKTDLFWLLLLIWKVLLEKAAGNGNIPRAYREEHKNLRHFRGRLDLPGHIRHNTADASRFYCKYRKLDADNTINRAILHVLRLASKMEHGDLLDKARPYGELLLSIGVQPEDVPLQDIDHVVYTPYTEDYRPLMAISKIIIDYLGASPFRDEGCPGTSFFIDMWELWESYLLHVLSKGMAPDYIVISPNGSKESIYLLEKYHRAIRPDFLVFKRGQNISADCPLLIIDAKYTNYGSFGKADKDMNGKEIRGAVRRNDLYQLVTYMHHYASQDRALTGLFVAPVNDAMEYLAFSRNRNQRIGLCNMNIELGGSDPEMSIGEKLKDNENNFIGRIKEILETMPVPDKVNLKETA